MDAEASDHCCGATPNGRASPSANVTSTRNRLASRSEYRTASSPRNQHSAGPALPGRGQWIVAV
eukprot:4183884-Pyramimonas_sp.AAC.1